MRRNKNIILKEKENQYSKGVRILQSFIYPQIKGKYVAICEGDDFWCDKLKLQKQFDFLEQNPEYSLCVHNTIVHNCLTGSDELLNDCMEDKDISFDDIVQHASAIFHTSSYMFRFEHLNYPKEMRLKSTADYSRAVFSATQGKVRYLHDVMSFYRKFTENSWTRRMYISIDSTDRLIAYSNEKIEMLKYLESCTNGEFTNSIKKMIRSEELKILVMKNDIPQIKSKFPEYYKDLRIVRKLIMRLKFLFPRVYKMYRKIRFVIRWQARI